MEAAIHSLALRTGRPRRAGGEPELPAALHRRPDDELGRPWTAGWRPSGRPSRWCACARCVAPRGRGRAGPDGVRRAAGAGRRAGPLARRRHPEAVERGLELARAARAGGPAPPRRRRRPAGLPRAEVRVAMVTGDHPGTAAAIAREVGLLRDGGAVVDGSALPDDDRTLAALLDRPEGAVVARVTPAGKLRIARVLRERGHVVAMTGDGVNDAPGAARGRRRGGHGRQRQRRRPGGRRPGAARRPLRHDRRRHRAGPGHVRERAAVPHLPPDRQRRRARAVRGLGADRRQLPPRDRRAAGAGPRHRHRHAAGARARRRAAQPVASCAAGPARADWSTAPCSPGCSACWAPPRR